MCTILMQNLEKKLDLIQNYVKIWINVVIVWELSKVHLGGGGCLVWWAQDHLTWQDHLLLSAGDAVLLALFVCDLHLALKQFAVEAVCSPSRATRRSCWFTGQSVFLPLPMARRTRRQVKEMSFLQRVSGLTLRDRVRSLGIQEELRVEHLMLCIKRSRLRWFKHLSRMPLACLLGEVFWACPSRKSRKVRPRTCWWDYISRPPWEHLGIPQKSWRRYQGRDGVSISA